MQKQYLSYADYLHLFQQHGGTDQGYLYGHYQRFCQTQKLFYENWSLDQGNRLLDVGAHWLHQAILICPGRLSGDCGRFSNHHDRRFRKTFGNGVSD